MTIYLLRNIIFSRSLIYKRENICNINKPKAEQEEGIMDPKLEKRLKDAFALADPNEILEGIERIKAKQQKKATAKIFPLFFLSLPYKQIVNMVVCFITMLFAPESTQLYTPVKVAIMDSGIDLIHVNDNGVPRYESLRELFLNGEVSGYDFYKSTGTISQDLNGHGIVIRYFHVKCYCGLKWLPNSKRVVPVYIYKILDTTAKGSEWT